MSKTSALLKAEQAQDFVENLINQYGLGALPSLKVLETPDGKWRIQWDDVEEQHKPMTAGQWRTWLDKRFGPGLIQRLETSEG